VTGALPTGLKRREARVQQWTKLRIHGGKPPLHQCLHPVHRQNFTLHLKFISITAQKHVCLSHSLTKIMPVPVATRSKMQVCGRSPAENVGSNPPRVWMFVVSVVCCQVVVSANELITRPEESYRLWCVVACDLETSWMRRP